jgi:uncharacterized membrane protein YkvA (DUF1232 family)
MNDLTENDITSLLKSNDLVEDEYISVRKLVESVLEIDLDSYDKTDFEKYINDLSMLRFMKYYTMQFRRMMNGINEFINIDIDELERLDTADKKEAIIKIVDLIMRKIPFDLIPRVVALQGISKYELLNNDDFNIRELLLEELSKEIDMINKVFNSLSDRINDHNRTAVRERGRNELASFNDIVDEEVKKLHFYMEIIGESNREDFNNLVSKYMKWL